MITWLSGVPQKVCQNAESEKKLALFQKIKRSGSWDVL
jgi:hypothetical protein